MGLFGFGKKKQAEETAPACTCQCGCSTDAATASTPVPAPSDTLSIKVLGTGCVSCHALLENTKQAVADMELDAKVEYVTDMAQIAGYGVMRMPALVINEKPVVVGKILKPEEITDILKKECN